MPLYRPHFNFRKLLDQSTPIGSLSWLFIEKLLRITVNLLITLALVSGLGLLKFGTYSLLIVPFPFIALLSSCGIRNNLRLCPFGSEAYSNRVAYTLFSEVLIKLLVSFAFYPYYIVSIAREGLTPDPLIACLLLSAYSILNAFEIREIVLISAKQSSLVAGAYICQLFFSASIKIFGLLSSCGPVFFFYTHSADQVLSIVLLYLASTLSKDKIKLFQFSSSFSPLGILSYCKSIIHNVFAELSMNAQPLVEKMLMAIIVSPSVFGIYSLMSRGLELQRIFNALISSVYVPHSVSQSTSTSSSLKRYRRILLILTSGLCAFAFLLPILSRFSSILRTYPIWYLLILSVLLSALAALVSSVSFTYNKSLVQSTRYKPYLFLVMILGYVALALFLIKLSPISGQLISAIAYNLVLYLYIKRSSKPAGHPTV